MSLKLTTDAFRNDGMIPERHSRRGGNISPSLGWTGIPAGTKSLALVVDDLDAPSGLFIHGLLFDLSPNSTGIEENQPASQDLPNGARQDRNGFGALGYGGLQPPSGTHRYFFHSYELDTDLSLPAGVSRQELDKALDGHILKKLDSWDGSNIVKEHMPRRSNIV